MIKLKSLLNEADAQAAPVQSSTAPSQVGSAPSVLPASQGSSGEYTPSFDFTDFEKTIAQSTETAKNNFQAKLMEKVGGKKVTIRASKGYGQPKKDYTINVTGVSIDFYYERYVVILKDEKDKEYFLETGMTIKILGPADLKGKKQNKVASPVPKTTVAPPQAAPNTATQGI
jgi:hypothetical protein